MKRLTSFIVCVLATYFCFAQPKNIILVMADGMGFNHSQIITSKNDCVLNQFDVKYAVCNYPTYWSTLDKDYDVQYYRGDYHVRRIWQEFDYADSLPIDPITAGSALATGVKPAFDAVSYDMDNTELETILERAASKGKVTGIATNGDIWDNNAVLPFVCHQKVANDFDAYDDLFFQMLKKKINVVVSPTAYGVDDENWIHAENAKEFPSSLEKQLLVGSYEFSSDDFVATNIASLDLLSTNEQGFVFVSEFTDIANAASKQDIDSTKIAMSNFEKYINSIYSWVEQKSNWDETVVFVVGSYEQGYLTSKSFDKKQPVSNFLSNNADDIQYNSEYATNLLTPLFAKGNGSEILHNYIDETDFLLGSYISNTEIAQTIFRLMPNEVKIPKNIILMVNDGCGISPIKMADYYTGKTASFEDFPVQLWNCTHASATSKKVNNLSVWNNTYESRLAWTDKKYFWSRNNATCSGASGTALATGKKTYYYSLGVDWELNALKSIGRYAKEIGKSAGVATNSPYNDATPGAYFTNNADRTMSGELARQVIIESNADVVIGCDHPEFDKNAQKKDAPSYDNIGGIEMLEGLRNNATDYAVKSNSGWSTVRDVDGDGQPDPWTFVEDSANLVQYMSGETPKRLFAIMPVEGSMQFYRTGTNVNEVHFDDWNPGMPKLWQIGRTAINCLSKNENGFFLMIEGDMVDNAGHKNYAGRHIEEQMSFNETVDSVISWIEKYSSWDETLLIITADHETGFVADPTFGEDSILLYHHEIIDNGVGQIPGLKYYSLDHTNQLVPLFAKGAGAEILERYADEWDFVRGKYLNNSEVGQTMFELWNGTACSFVNEHPTVNFTDSILLYYGEEFSYVVQKPLAIDKEDQVTITLTQAPAWIQYDEKTSTFSGKAPLANNQTYYVIFSATDGATTGASVTYEFKVYFTVVKRTPAKVESPDNTKIQVYPIPALTSIYVQTPSNQGEIYVRDVLGKVVKQQKINSPKTEIFVEDLQSGEYFVQIVEGKNVTTKKIIVR